MKRTATAQWKGAGVNGTGLMSSQSLELNQAFYSFNDRFSETGGTNPEELIAAAHATCFTQYLTLELNAHGYFPDRISTTCFIELEYGISIAESTLEVNMQLQGMDEKLFDHIIRQAATCSPVGKSMHARTIVHAVLNARHYYTCTGN